MPAKIIWLEPKDRAFLSDMCRKIYLDGECYAFSIALHRALGWPIVGLLMRDDVARHAVVQSPQGNYFDARGFSNPNEVCQPFGRSGDFVLQEISEEKLYATRQIDDYSIDRARRFAEALWPNLPWTDSFPQRVRKFTDELEALSQKHKLWIRACVPAAAPLIAKGDGEEGYVLTQTSDGLTFTIDRCFP